MLRPMKLHAFVAMPFGIKKDTFGKDVDFDRVFADLVEPALKDAGLEVLRADKEPRAGDIRSDMFQELLIADLVVADLTADNANVWYELGVRHALRARGVLLVQGPREKQPFDIYTDRKINYTLADGKPDPATLQADKAAIAKMAKATLESWHGRKISPVYVLVPNLQEPDWKALKVGDAMEFWQAHDAWGKQLDRARRGRKPGDILVLADETPVVALRAEAFFAAGEALRKLERFDFALEQYQRCLDVEPGNLKAGRMKGMMLQRLGRLDEARDQYRELLKTWSADAETWGLLGRVDKDAWTAAWRREGSTPQQQLDDAAYEDALLRGAIKSYRSGFSADANHYYSGINALTLMHLYKHLTKKTDFDAELAALAGGVRWAAWNATQRDATDFWPAATLGDLEVLAGTADRVRDAYKEAIRLLENDWFALNSTLGALELLQPLGFRADEVGAGIETFQRALARLQPPGADWQPRQVVLFSGHIVDAPGRDPPRFPESMIPAAQQRIDAALEALKLDAQDLVLTQGAAGGDLMFLESAQARGAQVQLLLPFTEPEFLQQSVAPRGATWMARYEAVKARLDSKRPIRCAPTELGAPPKGIDPYERCNLWLLNTALACGLDKVRLVALWNGGGGDGPGGTQHMVGEVQRRTGRVDWIDTRTL
jgi:tetratricopeptide (TPR) repeat protein